MPTPTVTPKQLDTLAAISVFGVTHNGYRLDVGYRCLAYVDDYRLAPFQSSIAMAHFFGSRFGDEPVPAVRTLAEINSRTVDGLYRKGLLNGNYAVTETGAEVLARPKGRARVEFHQRHKSVRAVHGWNMEDIGYGVMSRCRCGWKKPFLGEAMFEALEAWESHMEETLTEAGLVDREVAVPVTTA